MPDLSALAARPKRTITVRLVWDPNDAAAIDAAEVALNAAMRVARQRPTDDNVTAAEEAKAAHDELVAAAPVVEFVFEAIGTKAVDSLMAASPPSAEQSRDHKRDNPSAPPLAYDPDRYPLALIAATCRYVTLPEGDVVPVSSPDDLRDFFGSLSRQDQQRLFYAAASVDIDGTSIEAQVKG